MKKIMSLIICFATILSIVTLPINAGSNTRDITDSAMIWDRGRRTKAYQDYFVHCKGSKYSYRLSSQDANDIRLLMEYRVIKNTSYIVSAYIKTKDVKNLENSDNPLFATISVGDWNCSKSVSGTSEWQKVSMIVNSGDKTTMEISLNLGYWYNTCTGTAWFDNISVERVEDIKPDDNTWKFLCVIPKKIDIKYYDSVKRRTIKESGSVSDNEVDIITRVMKEFEASLKEDSFGKVVPVVEVMAIDDAITEISSFGDTNYWFSERNAYDYLERNSIDISKYDHVIFVSCFSQIPSDLYFGLGGTYINNYTGYSFIKFGDHYSWENWYDENSWMPSVFVHEFLHSVESLAKNITSSEFPSLHDAEKYNYSGENGWREWYTDYINGTVKKCKLYPGLPKAVWNIKPSMFN